MANKQPETTFDVLNRLAAAGDIGGVVDALVSDGAAIPGERKGEYIQAAATAAAKNCNQMIDDVLAMAIANTTELLMRATLMAKVKTTSSDKHQGPFMTLPKEVADVDLPRITRLEDRLIVLAKARATVLHTARLADASTTGALGGRIINLEHERRAVAKASS